MPAWLILPRDRHPVDVGSAQMFANSVAPTTVIQRSRPQELNRGDLHGHHFIGRDLRHARSGRTFEAETMRSKVPQSAIKNRQLAASGDTP